MFLLLNDLTPWSTEFDGKNYLRVYYQGVFNSKVRRMCNIQSFKSVFDVFFFSFCEQREFLIN